MTENDRELLMWALQRLRNQDERWQELYPSMLNPTAKRTEEFAELVARLCSK